MKLAVIGFGQCGGRIADEFCRLNSRACSHRRINVIIDTFAVNTDTADLSGLSAIRSDYQHRIVIGARRTSGHGVGKVNELAAEIAEEDGDKVLDALKSHEQLYEADAFMVIAGAAGGTGSGSVPVMVQAIKDRFKHRPVYALLVLPFEHEEKTDGRTFHNTATCLKGTYSVANAVFLVDNQRYIEKDASLINNIGAINKLVAAPFYDLLCAGEEKKVKRIGAKLLDAGDIIETLSGWTAIGYGSSQLPVIKLPFWRRKHFRNKITETHKGLHAMDEAISNLSLKCEPKDSSSALYLLSAPTKEMNVNLVKDLSEYMGELVPDAIVRYGDYPNGAATLTITVIVSRLSFVEKVWKYYDKMPGLIKKNKTNSERNEANLRKLTDAAELVPSLSRSNGDSQED
ncbi:MAG: cell division protein FtsZ [Chloroflexota bacterium]